MLERLEQIKSEYRHKQINHVQLRMAQSDMELYQLQKYNPTDIKQITEYYNLFNILGNYITLLERKN